MAIEDPAAALLTRLLDESSIRSVIATYASALDWMNWQVLEGLFAPDARIDFGEAFRGDRAAFMPFVKALEEGYRRRMHLFGEPRIVLRGDRADAEVASLTHTRAVGAEGRTDSVIYGRYLLELHKTAGAWRLAALCFLLNNFESSSSTASDAGPFNTAEDLSMSHPRAPRF